MEQKIEKILELLKSRIEQREQVWKNRSLDWKESYKGDHYKLQTEALKSILEEQQNVYDSLIDWKEND